MKTQSANRRFARGILSLILVIGAPCATPAETVGVFFNAAVPQDSFAAYDIKSALETKGFTPDMQPLGALDAAYGNKKIILAQVSNPAVKALLTAQNIAVPAGIGEQGFALRTTASPQKAYWVLGGDSIGSMYGGLQIAENIKFNAFNGDYSLEEAPHIKKRGVKFNLPMDGRSPTFRNNFSSTSHQVAIANVWDLEFWKTWFDQMARYRYNDLSIWTDHPFTAMLKMPDYPDVALQNVQDASGKVIKAMSIDEKVAFWKKVMEHGHNRGFDIYFFVWNLYIHGAEGKYGLTRSCNNALTTAYIRKCMKQFFETYPYLNGFGVTAGEEMDLDGAAAVQWMADSYGAGMKDYLAANPARKLVFINRSFMSSALSDVAAKYKPLTDLPNARLDVSFKYSQGHMYNTVVPDYNSKNAFLSDLIANKMKTWLTIRNDGIYLLHWGDPDFARKYLAGWPAPDRYLQGFYMGGDGFTFTKSFHSRNPRFRGELEINRLWYTFMLWGRLSYNPGTPDETFKRAMASKYAGVPADNLFTAWAKSSTAVPITTELLSKDWYFDFHWWPEACYSNEGFRTIGDFAAVSPGPGSNLCSIAASAANTCGAKPSSYKTADLLERNGLDALNLMAGMRTDTTTELGINLNNLRAQSYLGLYYAQKIRGATYNKGGKKDSALAAMGQAYCNWISYADLMDGMHTGMGMNRVDALASWHSLDAPVLNEYKGLGGTGVPVCKPVVGAASPSLPQPIAKLLAINSTGIEFQVDASARYGIKVFSAGGHLLAGLEGRGAAKGVSSAAFASPLPKGIYLVELRLKDSRFAQQRKMAIH